MGGRGWKDYSNGGLCLTESSKRSSYDLFLTLVFFPPSEVLSLTLLTRDSILEQFQ